MTQWQAKTGSEHPSRTEAGRMRVRELATGRVVDLWPPDASAAVESGAFAFVEVKPTRAVPMPLEAPWSERSLREVQAARMTEAIRAEPVRRRA